MAGNTFAQIDPFTETTVPQNPFTFWGKSWKRSGLGIVIGGSQLTMTGASHIEWEANTGVLNTIDLRGPSALLTSIVMPKTSGANATQFTLLLSDGTITQSVVKSGSGNLTWSFSEFATASVYTSCRRIRLTSSSNTGGSSSVFGVGGAEPHLVLLDGSRLEVYDDGEYCLFENEHCVVNMFVIGTFIEKMTVSFKEHAERECTVTYDVRTEYDLHARCLVQEGKEEQQEVDIELLPEGLVLHLEAKYRSFAIRNASWTPKQRIRVGGLLGGVQSSGESGGSGSGSGGSGGSGSSGSSSGGGLRDITVGHYEAHALACDAHFPHIVTFYGTSVIPGRGEHLLLRGGGVCIVAEMDDFSRLLSLRGVPGAEGVQWIRPNSSLCVNNKRVSVGCADFLVSLSSSSCTLLVRLQANGAASFAVTDVKALDNDGFEGLLVRGKKEQRSGGGGGYSSACYERAVEPHLAWARGDSILDVETFDGNGFRAATHQLTPIL